MTTTAVIDQFYEGIPISDYYQGHSTDGIVGQYSKNLECYNNGHVNNDFTQSSQSRDNDVTFTTLVGFEQFLDNFTGQILADVVDGVSTAIQCSAKQSEAIEELLENSLGGDRMETSSISFSEDAPQATEELSHSTTEVSDRLLDFCHDEAGMAISTAMQQHCRSNPDQFSVSSQLSLDFYHFEGSIATLTYQDFPSGHNSQSQDNQGSPVADYSPESIQTLIYQDFPPPPPSENQSHYLAHQSSSFKESLLRSPEVAQEPNAELAIVSNQNQIQEDLSSSSMICDLRCTKDFPTKELDGDMHEHSDLGHVELYYAIRDGKRGNVYISQLDCSCLTKYWEIEM